MILLWLQCRNKVEVGWGGGPPPASPSAIEPALRLQAALPLTLRLTGLQCEDGDGLGKQRSAAGEGGWGMEDACQLRAVKVALSFKLWLTWPESGQASLHTWLEKISCRRMALSGVLERCLFHAWSLLPEPVHSVFWGMQTGFGSWPLWRPDIDVQIWSCCQGRQRQEWECCRFVTRARSTTTQVFTHPYLKINWFPTREDLANWSPLLIMYANTPVPGHWLCLGWAWL